jgi:hypothetical protein
VSEPETYRAPQLVHLLLRQCKPFVDPVELRGVTVSYWVDPTPAVHLKPDVRLPSVVVTSDIVSADDLYRFNEGARLTRMRRKRVVALETPQRQNSSVSTTRPQNPLVELAPGEGCAG